MKFTDDALATFHEHLSTLAIGPRCALCPGYLEVVSEPVALVREEPGLYFRLVCTKCGSTLLFDSDKVRKSDAPLVVVED